MPPTANVSDADARPPQTVPIRDAAYDAAADRTRVLIVDDEPGIRRPLSMFLESQGCHVRDAEDVATALAHFDRGLWDVVITDIAMPGKDGIELLREVKSRDPDVEVIMITGYLDVQYAIKALKMGAFDYFQKPFEFDRILVALQRVAERRMLRREAREADRLRIEQGVMAKAVLETTLGFARAVEERDRCNIGHGQRTATLAAMLGTELGFDAEHVQKLREAALLHDVGKIAIDDAILNKPGRLTEEEFATIRRHAEIGDYMLSPVSFLGDIRKAVRHHHERWDGKGYPDGLAGTDIPLDARILTIADYFDSITSMRPYRKPMTVDQAETTMRADLGAFDPELLEIFLRKVRSVLAPT